MDGYFPAPLREGILCSDCNGTGADRKKTLRARRSYKCDSRSYIYCWTCNGRGIDPSAYFRFSRSTEAGDETRAHINHNATN